MDVVELRDGLSFLRFDIGHAYLWRDPAGLTLIDCGVAGSGPRIAGAIAECSRTSIPSTPGPPR